jgi:hypothetical protein
MQAFSGQQVQVVGILPTPTAPAQPGAPSTVGQELRVVSVLPLGACPQR